MTDGRMTVVYKVTSSRGTTIYGDWRWAPEKTYTIPESERGNTIGLPGLIHVYTDATYALLAQPYHLAISDPVVWESTTPEIISTDGEKHGCHTLTTHRCLARPDWYESRSRRYRRAQAYARHLLSQLPRSEEAATLLTGVETAKTKTLETLMTEIHRHRDTVNYWEEPIEDLAWIYAQNLVEIAQDWRYYGSLTSTMLSLAQIISSIAGHHYFRLETEINFTEPGANSDQQVPIGT